MNRHIILLSSLIIASGVVCAEPLLLKGAPSTTIARPLLERDPRVAAARAKMEAALQEAGIIKRSPYEWNATTTAQVRRLDNGPRYNEWNVGVERTIRLPGKTVADSEIAKWTIEESEASYSEALHSSASELLNLWLDWVYATKAFETASTGLLSSQQSVDAVETRTKAGDASRLDLNIARAELAEQKRLSNNAKTQVLASAARLANRYPGTERLDAVLPDISHTQEDEAYWMSRTLEQNDGLRVANAKWQVAQGQTLRAKANKIPDPTLGVFAASELGNREHIYGVSFSIPIPSESRGSRHAKALAEEEYARQDADLKKRELQSVVASNVALTQGAYESYINANEAAVAMASNASQMQRAYQLGEVDLQSMLLARRQSLAAAATALESQVEALRLRFSLLIDAHLIWELDKI